MGRKLVKPLRELFQAKCAFCGPNMACPTFIGRHPFPVRVLPFRAPRRKITRQKLDILREADA